MDNEFYVLHLSDLHIKNNGTNENYYSMALENLIQDIKEQTKDYQAIILVISGDIIDKAEYSTNKETVLLFFKKLSKFIKDRIYDIQIVPGNHDRQRTELSRILSIAHSLEDINTESIGAQTEWSLHRETYNSFIEIINKIYEIFELDKTVDNTFGVEVVDIKGNNICFIRIDTAWCSYSNKDIRNLRIGEYQRQLLKNEYQDLKNKFKNEKKPLKLTIAISHHPLKWLKPDEEDIFMQYILDDDYLDVDILMCGHVHDREIINYFNHNHSIMTLVTGIGWGINEPNDSKEQHRYSIYTINTKHNSCDIIMRRSKSDLKFDYDYSAYIGKEEKYNKKLSYPLRIRESQPFLHLSSPNPLESKSIYIDNEILKYIFNVSEGISKFNEEIYNIMGMYKKDFLDTLPDDKVLRDQIDDFMNIDTKLTKEIEKSLNIDIVFLNFMAFLQEICSSFIDAFKIYFSDNVFLRAHFRWYNISKDNFLMLCQHNNLDKNLRNKRMQSIKWGGLIKQAFENDIPLVYSANIKYNKIKTEWNDFITIIPRFNNCCIDKRIYEDNRYKNESRPILTFGFSIKYNGSESSDSMILYVLDYLKINQQISNVIDNYIRVFNIDTKVLLKHISNIKNRETIDKV
ncbi:MAG: metallophosphoesterase family protein [Eubacteriaceae bacterium]